MWLRNPLDDILSSPAKIAVLRVLLGTNSPLSGRELSRRAGLSYAPTWKALERLVASGVLIKRQHGTANTYELRNPDSLLMHRLRDAFWAEQRRYQDVVSDIVDGIPEAVSVILFGSEARDEARSGSDTDLLIVVARQDDRLAAKVREVSMALAERHDLALSWHVADFDDLRDWEATGNAFWQNVLKDGVKLHGDSLEDMRRRWQHGKTS